MSLPQMLQESGLVPFEAPKKPTSALFSQPTAAEVSAPTQQPMLRANGRPHAMVRRSDAQNQRIYEVTTLLLIPHIADCMLPGTPAMI